MRIDKFTTKFQEALSDAQSLAVGGDQQFIEPVHLLAALLRQDDDASASLLSRAGVNVAGLKADVDKALGRLPHLSPLSAQTLRAAFAAGFLLADFT